LLFLFLLGTYALAKWGGYLDDINIHRIQRAVEDAGAWGVLLFAGLFVVGVLLHLPGMIFVGTAIIVIGRDSGYFISLGSATLAVCISFLIARTIGGKALGEVKASFVRRLLKRIDDHPIRVMIVFRLIFFLSPPLNFMIALTRIRFRDYAVGSAVGLIIPMFAVTVLFDWLLATEWVRQWLFN